jgi:putative endonuclease
VARIEERGGADRRSARGAEGERAAERWYRARGFRVVARNWRSSLGELDLVLGRGDLIVFAEVKTRTGDAFGGPFEAVAWRKQRKLRQLGEAFAMSHRSVSPGARFRFDVASVMLDPTAGPLVHVFEDAF